MDVRDPRYTAAESSRLIGLPDSTVRRWMADPTLLERVGPSLLSFLDLVELHTAAKLIQHFGFDLSALRARLREASQRLALDHPLARRSFLVEPLKLWLPLEEGVLELGGGGQLGLVNVVKHVAEKIEFDVDGLAERWFPAGRDGGVVIDPRRASGSPIVPGTRISTAVLYDMWRAEGADVARVASWYELPIEAVEKAVAFERRLAS